MQVKRNDATLNRPAGERVLDAPFVFANLDEYARQLKDEKAWDKNDRNGITIFKSNNLTVVVTRLHKDAVIKDNFIDGLFQVQLLKGKIRITTVEGDNEMKEGEMMIFHPHVKHTVEALKKSTLLLQIINNDYTSDLNV